MERKLTNIEEFTSKLQSYKATLEEMNRLTADEIDRLNSLAISITDSDTFVAADATIFINQQVNSFFEKLTALVEAVPRHTFSKEVFLTEEIQWLQGRVLERLKELGASNNFIA